MNGLPEELDQVKVSLHGNLAGRSLVQILPTLTHVAHAVGFNDRLPREEAATNMTPTPGAPTSNRPKSPAKEGPKGPYCKKCPAHGHLQRDGPEQKEVQELRAPT